MATFYVYNSAVTPENRMAATVLGRRARNIAGTSEATHPWVRGEESGSNMIFTFHPTEEDAMEATSGVGSTTVDEIGDVVP